MLHDGRKIHRRSLAVSRATRNELDIGNFAEEIRKSAAGIKDFGREGQR